MLSRDLAESVAQVVGEQFGLVTTAQLSALGVSELELRGLLRRGNLVGVTRGLYRSPYFAETWDQVIYAACLMNGAKAAASHFTAAKILALDVAWPDEMVHITVPGGAHPNSLGGRIAVHRSTCFGPGDRTFVEPFTVTSVARTLSDIARFLSRRRVARVVDDALSRRIVQPLQLATFLDRPELKRRPGRNLLLSALGPWIEGTRPASVAEADALRLFAEWGLPKPTCQHPIKHDGIVVAKVDFAWLEHRVAVEVNGFRYHSNPKADATDSKRLSQIQAAGWVVVGVTPTEITLSAAHFRQALLTHLNTPRPLGGVSRPV
jgi:hypothetical protein